MTTMRKQCECGCGEWFETADTRKRFVNKKHADRNRNRTSAPISKSQPEDEGLDLKRFSKYTQDIQESILLGKAGFSVCMFDIEATNLKPNVGRILCCSFKPIGGEVYTFDALEPRFKKPDVYDDGELAAAIRDELEKYDIIVGWNSKNYDIKFINSRCVHAGTDTKMAQYHVDGMWSWRSKLSAWSKLTTVQTFLGTEEHKTSVEWEKWMQALGWDKKLREAAMDSIVEHCELDVIVLEEVYEKIVQFNMIRSLRRDGGIL